MNCLTALAPIPPVRYQAERAPMPIAIIEACRHGDDRIDTPTDPLRAYGHTLKRSPEDVLMDAEMVYAAEALLKELGTNVPPQAVYRLSDDPMQAFYALILLATLNRITSIAKLNAKMRDLWTTSVKKEAEMIKKDARIAFFTTVSMSVVSGALAMGQGLKGSKAAKRSISHERYQKDTLAIEKKRTDLFDDRGRKRVGSTDRQSDKRELAALDQEISERHRYSALQQAKIRKDSGAQGFHSASLLVNQMTSPAAQLASCGARADGTVASHETRLFESNANDLNAEMASAMQWLDKANGQQNQRDGRLSDSLGKFA